MKRSYNRYSREFFIGTQRRAKASWAYGNGTQANVLNQTAGTIELYKHPAVFVASYAFRSRAERQKLMGDLTEGFDYLILKFWE